MSIELTEKTYLENFRSDCLRTIKNYASKNSREHVQVLEQMKSIVENRNLSEINVWEALDHSCEYLYHDRFLPRYIWKHDLDAALEYTLTEKYPLKKIKVKVTEHLYISNLSQNTKIREMETKNTDLQTELEKLQKSFEKVSEENESLKKDKVQLQERVLELENASSVNSHGSSNAPITDEWKAKYEELLRKSVLIPEKYQKTEEELQVLKVKLEALEQENEKLRKEKMLLEQKNKTLVRDSRSKAEEIFNLKSSLKDTNETRVYDNHHHTLMRF